MSIFKNNDVVITINKDQYKLKLRVIECYAPYFKGEVIRTYESDTTHFINPYRKGEEVEFVIKDYAILRGKIMCKIKSDVMKFIKKIFDKAIYAGVGFFVGCCFGNLLTVHHHPVALTFLAFIIAAGSAAGKVLTRNI